jgi:hypothetical protein
VLLARSGRQECACVCTQRPGSRPNGGGEGGGGGGDEGGCVLTMMMGTGVAGVAKRCSHQPDSPFAADAKERPTSSLSDARAAAPR